MTKIGSYPKDWENVEFLCAQLPYMPKQTKIHEDEKKTSAMSLKQ